MSTIGIFIAGSVIFGSYMFFLTRMIWKQHKIQAEELKMKDFKLTKVEGGLKNAESDSDENNEDRIEIKYRVG